MVSGKEPKELKPEQSAVVETLNRHLSVTAGPGSGKTTVLVKRYLYILRQNKDLNIDQIVAITFTNRAANEMRERLRKDLDEILETCPGEERRRWMRYKRTLDGAVINTIHGYCARLLREFPIEAGVDPQFLLLDNHDATMLLEAAAEETLTGYIRAGGNLVSQLTIGYGRVALAHALVQLYTDIRGQGLKLDDIRRQTIESHSTLDTHTRALAELDRTMSELIAAAGSSLTGEEKLAYVRVNWPTLRAQLASQPRLAADYCNAIVTFRARGRPPKTSRAAAIVARLDGQLWGEKKNGAFGLVPQITFDLLAKDYALELIRMLTEVDRRFSEKKRKLAALDFEDLQLGALELLRQPSVLARITQRYGFFLVDEFQDTNPVQRELLHKLTLEPGASANMFIVGDRKQSIYGFRGADVDVFQETTKALKAAGGSERSLHLNFRSQPPLISFNNYLFERLFKCDDNIEELRPAELGFVNFEASTEQRATEDSLPLADLLIDTKSPSEADPKAELTPAERDAKQVAKRILSLTATDSREDAGKLRAPARRFCDIALLFRAMTEVQTYEAVFRRCNIPFQTIQGKGFYEREEISDLIQLLRFLDNKTDEIALAGVLRSPIGGISDNALLALRCAPWLNETDCEGTSRHFSSPRPLFYGLKRHRDVAYLAAEDHSQIDRVLNLLGKLIERRNHYPIADLLRLAVEESEYLTVISANFDGAQRLANVQKLFSLAERFARSGTQLIRDLVRYVEEFEAVGSREAEGQIDESANAVRLMSIHQSKGLQFPVVIIPNLHSRAVKLQEHWYALDRHRGLTLKIPDGRGKQLAGCTFEKFRQRMRWREQFESIRLLYVAATRAEDRLILSGVTDELLKLNGSPDSWLRQIWQKLELQESRSNVVKLGNDAELAITLNLADEPTPVATALPEITAKPRLAKAETLIETFPLLARIDPQSASSVPRFSVSQLINYQRCPRQYYFDRVLRVPSPLEVNFWNDAEATEAPGNLTATLKGAVIHRFCETYSRDEDRVGRLRLSLDEILEKRSAELADHLLDISSDRALEDLLPLVENYLASDLFKRIETARQKLNGNVSARPAAEPGLWSELSFRLRRPGGIVSGVIDKLLISRSGEAAALNVEIIDFKTNRLKAQLAKIGSVGNPAFATYQTAASAAAAHVASPYPTQIRLDFENSVVNTKPIADITTAEAVTIAAGDYQLQMQAYALAVRQLIPSLQHVPHSISVTLHFLEPNIEFRMPPDFLRTEVCSQAIDQAMRQILSSWEPEHFSLRPANHCRTCKFLQICPGGRQWLVDN